MRARRRDTAPPCISGDSPPRDDDVNDILSRAIDNNKTRTSAPEPTKSYDEFDLYVAVVVELHSLSVRVSRVLCVESTTHHKRQRMWGKRKESERNNGREQNRKYKNKKNVKNSNRERTTRESSNWFRFSPAHNNIHKFSVVLSWLGLNKHIWICVSWGSVVDDSCAWWWRWEIRTAGERNSNDVSISVLKFYRTI